MPLFEMQSGSSDLIPSEHNLCISSDMTAVYASCCAINQSLPRIQNSQAAIVVVIISIDWLKSIAFLTLAL